ncbi:C-type lectin domain family 4 member K [Trachemys scripta elegans]|uniref:C-type lectin domain family 4 member K n=1 Tax=Trachemys scripta elegans TaxID=31138 RepID=UPI00155732E0|nr:C-type lectin domain family 4 member K [Trachemys scripta elegans]
MRDEWERKAIPDGESVVEYVLTFRERLPELMGPAREKLVKAQRKEKVWFDCTARAHAFTAGDQVMVLIPVRKNKLQAAWEGPFRVVKQLNKVNYVVELSNRAHHHRVYHVNMMKPYYDRGNVVLAVCGQFLDCRAQSKLQAVEEAVQKLQVSLQPDNASDASAKGSDSDVLTKLPRGWRFYGGNFYYFSQERKSWDEAERFCVSQDSHLTSVSSQAEQEFLSNETQGEDRWIGLTDRGTEGSWRWVDGTEYRADASRGFWMQNEPNNAYGGEDCVHTEPRYQNLWNDNKCIRPFRWICKQPHGQAGL